MLPHLEELGIGKGVLMSSGEKGLPFGTNKANKKICDQFPDRYAWMCSLSPKSKEPVFDRLARYKEQGAVGIGELTFNHRLDDPFLQEVFAAAEKLDMPVTIHISPRLSGYGIVDELGLPRIEKMLKKHPNLTLLGHSSPFWSEISADNSDQIRGGYPTGKVKEGRLAGLMRDYGNLYCDLSAGSGCNAMMRDPEYAARFIDEFADRMLYGCDICWADSTFPFQFQKFLDSLLDQGSITPENYSKIVRHNAEKILKL